jgi:hypothetical protein
VVEPKLIRCPEARCEPAAKAGAEKPLAPSPTTANVVRSRVGTWLG